MNKINENAVMQEMTKSDLMKTIGGYGCGLLPPTSFIIQQFCAGLIAGLIGKEEDKN